MTGEAPSEPGPKAPHQPLPPFAGWDGPRDAKIVLVGEAWGEYEAESNGLPLIGSAGKELWRLLGETFPGEPGLHAEATRFWPGKRRPWLEAQSMAFTNTLAFRPPDNKLEPLMVPKAQATGDHPALGGPGKYLAAEFLPELDRLRAELGASPRNLVVALGNTASWASLWATNITSIRGAITHGDPRGVCPGTKVLPTFHPAAVLRKWDWRPILQVDLVKAERERGFPEIRRPMRRVLVSPTLVEIEDWVLTFEGLRPPPPLEAIDIETARGQITCISFSYRPDEALVIPFVIQGRNGPSWRSFWPTQADEFAAWRWVERLTGCPIPKLGQNFLYDIQYLRKARMKLTGCSEDTMLQHHSLFPEFSKGLGFLGSVYTNEPAWKLMRRAKAQDSDKKDE